jgi:hypothetical protein
MKREPCPVENFVEVDMVEDGRYAGKVVWLKLLGGATHQGGLFPMTFANALCLSYALDARLNQRPPRGKVQG